MGLFRRAGYVAWMDGATVLPSASRLKPAIRTLRLKVRTESYRWLNAAASEVNQVWNFCNESSFKARRPFAGAGRWLSGFDLCNLTAGASKYFAHIGADTIQRVCIEYAAKRMQAKKAQLRWRRSREPRRSLGWIPLKAASIQRHGRYLRFAGKVIRIFEADRFGQVERWQQGCFAQDAVGDWYLCLPVIHVDHTPPATDGDVGIDLGLKVTAVTSDEDRLAAGDYYRSVEAKIAQAQRRGHRRQAKRLHRRAQRRRHNALHAFSRKIVRRYQHIYIGNVSSRALTQTRLAKAVLDTGWVSLKRQLQYKGEHAGRVVEMVDERNSSRACSNCAALTGPQGVNGLRVRVWTCSGCGVTHDRDVNASVNHRTVGRKLPSVRGNETRCNQRRRAGHNARARHG
jgi:putative transposase